ncbi:MAG TPA: K(+)-transporting ATPase subunit C [Streptosporangiaceae bacterium]|nr:K(+)-transporting ATPase subunit C [Streptosporangiaceae bacterium]
MSALPSTIRQLLAALRGWIIFTVICGLLYPLVVFGLGQAFFSHQADGSLVSFHGKVVGSSLICQEFLGPKGKPLPQYFQPRPAASAASATNQTGGCDPLATEASNLGPNNPELVADIKARRMQIARFDNVPVSAIPPDAVTVSASGLDAYISPQYAAIQVDRVAAARHISQATVRSLVATYTFGRPIGILGEPGVNVLLLNIALDKHHPVP